jgi:hypothetical protein
VLHTHVKFETHCVDVVRALLWRKSTRQQTQNLPAHENRIALVGSRCFCSTLCWVLVSRLEKKLMAFQPPIAAVFFWFALQYQVLIFLALTAHFKAMCSDPGEIPLRPAGAPPLNRIERNDAQWINGEVGGASTSSSHHAVVATELLSTIPGCMQPLVMNVRVDL